MQQPKVAIVGGSLVGPAAALFLRQQGLADVTVYEANPHPHNQSGGVMGVRYGNLDLLAGIGVRRADVVALRDPDVHAFDVRDGKAHHRGSSTFPGMITSWDALHAQLADRAEVQHGHRVVSVVDDGQRQYLTCFKGCMHGADVVIWADGRKSTGRELTDPDQPLAYNGYVVWRGLVDPPTDTPHGFHRYYDIEGGRLFSVTEPIAQSGKSYWEFSHNLPAAQWARFNGGKRPEEHAFMLPHQVHADARETIRVAAEGMPHAFEDMIEHSEVSGIPVNDVPMPAHAAARRGQGWSVRLGDALVPVRLQVGAGLNHGLSQAAELAAALNAPDRAAALECWSQAVLSNLARVVEQGRSRAHRTNLGWYLPVRPGKTTAPASDQWDDPQWVTA